MEKANHSAAQRWWRTVADDTTAAAAQVSLDAFCARIGDARTRRRDGQRTTVGALATAEPLAPLPPAFPATVRVERIGDRLFAPLLLSLLGMRPAEVCGLRWRDVDLDARSLTIANTRTLVAGQMLEKGPKSEKGKRHLPLPAPVTAALRAFKTRQAAERLAAGPAYTETGYVLVDEIGEPWRTDQLRRAAYRLMDRVGTRKVRLYDARHACLTFLATSGVPDVVVSAWAGHADLSFTKRTYVHPKRRAPT